MKVSRRQFVSLAGLTAAAGVGTFAVTRARRSVGGASAANVSTRSTYVTANGQASGRPTALAPVHARFAEDRGVYGTTADGTQGRRIGTTFGGHGLFPNRAVPNTFVVLEKWGAGASAVDWVHGVVAQSFAPRANCVFYGHGTFTEAGDALLLSESTVDTAQGYLTLRDPKTYAILGALDIGGFGPHDCASTEDGKHVIVALTGRNMSYAPDGHVVHKRAGDSSVAVVEVASGRVVERIPTPDGALSLTHLLCTKTVRDRVFIGTTPFAPRSQGAGNVSVVMGTLGGEMRVLRAPDEVQSRLVTEILSFAEHVPSGIVGATCPAANIVTFWDAKSGDYRGKIDLPAPNGICTSADGTSFAISGAHDGALTFVSPTTFEVVPSPLALHVGNGSHLYRFDLAT